MWQVYGSGTTLHDPTLEDHRLTKASLDLELGKTGSFDFVIYPNHPGFANIVPLRSIITVAKNYKTIYKGRVLDIKYGFYGEKQVSCEGVLAFLLDTMIPPHKYSGSFAGYFDYVVTSHNGYADDDKQFWHGVVTVADYAPFAVEEKEYRSAYDLLMTHSVNPSGGYLHVRYDGDRNYIDLLSYTADVSDVSGQKIELGVNLLDIKRETKSEDMFSAIIPLGAKIGDTETRLDIKGVNNGVPYIVNAAAKELCGGLIYRTVIFDNVTNATTLKSTASAYLTENHAGESSIEITAADLSGRDQTIDSFDIGRWVRVSVQHHFDGEQLFLIKKQTLDLLSPASNKIVIGAVHKGISDAVAEISNAVKSREDDAVQPYVMESGTTGIFRWKVFSDGTCEFFGKVPITSADVTSALGGWYRGANLYEATAYEYPFTMTEAPAINMTFQTRNGLAALLWMSSIDADTAQRYLPQAFLIRPTTATGIYGNINIIGKGKIA